MKKEKKYPIVYKFEEKHGEHYYLINNIEEADKLWLQVLQERFDEGWYSWMKDYVPYKMEIPTYTKEEILALPDSMETEKTSMLAKFKKYRIALKEQDEIIDNYEKIKEAIKTKNSKLAYALLQEFSQGEYEGFEEIHLSTIY